LIKLREKCGEFDHDSAESYSGDQFDNESRLVQSLGELAKFTVDDQEYEQNL
jgi:hypothetical protein